MPSGRTHDRITWLCSVPTLAGTWQLTGRLVPTLCVAGAFVFAGLMFSGDLDLPSVQYKRWGPLRWLWKPYQWLVPHRSRLSHGIILGPAVRLLYVMLMGALIGALALAALSAYGRSPSEAQLLAASHQALALGRKDQEGVLAAMAGLWLGGASHTLADVTVSAWKRFWRKGRKRR
jgi:uncharacterized metal-binding protein